MDSLAAATAPKLVIPATNSPSSVQRLLGSRLNLKRTRKKLLRAHAAENTRPRSTAIDFSDPQWPSRFQEDFEARFNIPHLTDVFRDDVVPIPSTFCLKMRYLENLILCVRLF
ncbi:hypothetical protein RHGRI_030080 [Rhododendron griersonianum]|uniref:Uncharacterized protein n=1 Tax=Rhododendron griersonianum TaxID=479676 RepID=A0AAV6IPV3_9ERIC|nr:hypothetical protein RHGRI_030080 [Rhododendron griersonianum]